MIPELTRMIARLRAMFSKDILDRELDEELATHLELLTEENVRRGMDPQAARREAVLRIGSLEAARERHRDVRSWRIGEGLARDVRDAARMLRKNAGFTTAALLTLAATIGGITLVFALVHSVLLQRLPYPEPHRLVRISQSYTSGGFGWSGGVNPADFVDIQRDTRGFDALAAYRDMSYVFDEDVAPYRALLWSATPDVFQVFGIRPILGRALLPEDEDPVSPAVAVIGHDLWQSRFGGSVEVIGQKIRFPSPNGGFDPSREMTIVGVLPPGFQPPVGGASVADITAYAPIWTALRLPATPNRRAGPPSTLTVVGRLRPGIDMEAARAETDVVSKRLAAEYADTSGTRTTMVTPLKAEVVGRVRTLLWIFFGAVSCVLLIGVANLTSLQLVRNAARDREIYIRTALGAGRVRLIRQLLVETVMLGIAGGALGLLVAWGGTRAVVASLPARFPRSSEIGIDVTVLLFVVGVSLSVGIVFGLLPAWRASRPDLSPAVNEGSRSATMSAHRARTQRSLIAVETALALVLLVGSALLTNSFWRLLTVDAGMDEHRLWGVTIDLPVRYRHLGTLNEEAPTLHFWSAALESVRALPQVDSAAAGMLPLSGGGITLGAVPEGVPLSDQSAVPISYRPVSVDYFRTAGIRVLEGRPILMTDTAGAERVVVLNEAAARSLWPGEDPIGKRVELGRAQLTVVGIVPDFKHSGLHGDIEAQMYTSYVQRGNHLPGIGVTGMMVRLREDAGGFADAVQSAIKTLEKDADITIASMSEMRWQLVSEERFRTAILGIFAGTATFLAVIGIFGVVGYTVVQRHREIGVRMALGATPRRVTYLMAGQALVPAAIGLAVGLAAAAGLTRLLASFLYEIQPNDPLTYTGALAGLALTALVASLIPARKAAQVNPAITLRCE